jgi:hypothetical protein
MNDESWWCIKENYLYHNDEKNEKSKRYHKAYSRRA